MPKSRRRRKADLAAAEELRRQLQDRHARNLREPLLSQPDVRLWLEAYKQKFAERVEAYTPGDPHKLVPWYAREVLNFRDLSPHDDPVGSIILKRLCRTVEETYASLQMPLGSGVAFGIEPSAVLNGAHTNVIATEASIVSFGAFFFPFCGLVSKALASSLPHSKKGSGRIEVVHDPDEVLRYVESSPRVVNYWKQIIFSYAVVGGPWVVPRFEVKRLVRLTRFYLLDAMETFAVAHEYAHHIHARNTRLWEVPTIDENHNEEHFADVLGAIAARYIGRTKRPFNRYAQAGVGPLLMLRTLDMVRRARHLVSVGTDELPASPTHPQLEERLKLVAGLDSLAEGREQYLLATMRECFEEICMRVWTMIAPIFLEMHKDGLGDVAHENSVWVDRAAPNLAKNVY